MDYVSPEVLKGMSYDKNVDLWGIGVLIFELASGHTPFEAVDHPSIMKNICKV